MTHLKPLRPLFAIAIVAVLPMPLMAATVSSTSTSPLDWDCAWSILRWLILIAIAVVAWLAFFHGLFPSRLAVRSTGQPPWPIEAFGESAFYVAVSLVVGFVIVFAGISDELTRTPVKFLPGGDSFINRNLVWMAILAVGIGLSALLRFALFRHRSS